MKNFEQLFSWAINIIFPLEIIILESRINGETAPKKKLFCQAGIRKEFQNLLFWQMTDDWTAIERIRKVFVNKIENKWQKKDERKTQAGILVDTCHHQEMVFLRSVSIKIQAPVPNEESEIEEKPSRDEFALLPKILCFWWILPAARTHPLHQIPNHGYYRHYHYHYPCQ